MSGIISLGIGSPASVPLFLTFGLSINATIPAAHFARGYTTPRMKAEVSIEGRQTAFARTTPRHLATVETEP